MGKDWKSLGLEREIHEKEVSGLLTASHPKAAAKDPY